MDIPKHKNELLKIILQNRNIRTILERTHVLGLPEWYLGAGCIAQTVWNYYHDYDLTAHIKDYDLIYFDADLSESKELYNQQNVKDLFGELNINLDVVNQGRVHTWYETYFGYPIKPYDSINEAIATWPTSATAVAVTYLNNKDYKILASLGLEELLSLIVRANKVQITEEIYTKKLHRWSLLWQKLKIIPWNES